MDTLGKEAAGQYILVVRLDADVQDYLAEQAARKGILLNEMINDLLKQAIQFIESIK